MIRHLKTMKQVFPSVLACLMISNSFGRDFRPQGRIEHIQASDTSVQDCYVFPTLPGVVYTVETSHDLIDWVAVDEVYGLGNDYVVSMREYTPPPPPSSGSALPLPHPPPATNISLCIQPCSDVGGGDDCVMGVS